jgi:excisionase family DNA binding protein
MSAVRVNTAFVLDDEVVDGLVATISERVLEELSRRQPDTCNGLYMNTEQAARYLACSHQRIYDLVSAGRLSAFKEGTRSLYRRDDLDALVQEAWPHRGPTAEKTCKRRA